jgi:ribosomal protein L39E
MLASRLSRALSQYPAIPAWIFIAGTQQDKATVHSLARS